MVPVNVVADNIKVGDRVRVKPGVTTPKYKWGSVTHRSIGIVTAISANSRDVTVDFPQQAHWTGLLSEMELVPSTHLAVMLVLSTVVAVQVCCVFTHDYVSPGVRHAG